MFGVQSSAPSRVRPLECERERARAVRHAYTHTVSINSSEEQRCDDALAFCVRTDTNQIQSFIMQCAATRRVEGRRRMLLRRGDLRKYSASALAPKHPCIVLPTCTNYVDQSAWRTQLNTNTCASHLSADELHEPAPTQLTNGYSFVPDTHTQRAPKDRTRNAC